VVTCDDRGQIGRRAVERYADIEGEWYLSYRRSASETGMSRRRCRRVRL